MGRGHFGHHGFTVCLDLPYEDGFRRSMRIGTRPGKSVFVLS